LCGLAIHDGVEFWTKVVDGFRMEGYQIYAYLS
jgi:hypothetical protein